MYTITVFEKVLDKLEAKMYSFDDKIEMAKFAVFAENEGAMVVMNIGLKLTV
ncbi:hypothetical protein [Paenibacillus ottowii]|uniref:hypothetical protein n=1 Tax=Paenibacillus ottowii TaxID=2315729 RepID=UPI002DBF0DA8|nr:hypothetical protein [Paenibacillus sp. CMAA1739]